MKSVLTQEWLDDMEGHSGRIAAYSLHLTEKDRAEFVRDHGKELEEEGRSYRPIGRSAVVGVDDEVYEQLKLAGHGMWYDGKAYWGGKEYKLGSRSN